jgi:hypothetical protein
MPHSDSSSDIDFVSKRLLARGADAVVSLLPDGRTVVKRYADIDRDLAGKRALLEFEALQRSRDILSRNPSVTCPEPVSVNLERGEVFMTFQVGEHLDRALSKNRYAQSQEIRVLADRLADAFSLLCETLHPDEIDFSVRNTLLDANTGIATLLDFSSRPRPRADSPGITPIERALASFLASTVTYQLHHETMLRFRASQRLRTLARLVFAYVSKRQYVDPTRVRSVAWGLYWRQSANRGWKRYLWFKSFGAIAFAVWLRLSTRTSRFVSIGESRQTGEAQRQARFLGRWIRD